MLGNIAVLLTYTNIKNFPFCDAQSRNLIKLILKSRFSNLCALLCSQNKIQAVSKSQVYKILLKYICSGDCGIPTNQAAKRLLNAASAYQR